MRPTGLKYTGEKATRRREGKARREAHKLALVEGKLEEPAPPPLPPEAFREVQDLYWKCLKNVSDPRTSSMVVYPLWLILHRIISGLLGGARYITPLFPAKHHSTEPVQSSLGALPTRPAVTTLLPRIDWNAAHQELAPLWEHLGFEKSLILRRSTRDPKVILAEFSERENERSKEKEAENAAKKAARRESEKQEGMSAAQAKRCSARSKRSRKAAQKSAPRNPVKRQPLKKNGDEWGSCRVNSVFYR